MIGVLTTGRKRFEVDFATGIPLAVNIGGPSGQSFYVHEPAALEPLQLSGFPGSVAAGGSCNVDRICWIPHCHGTHTEGVGHLLPDSAPVLEQVDFRPCLAQLLTPELVPAADSGEHYHHVLHADEALIGAQALQRALGGEVVDPSVKALIIRTRQGAARPYPILSSEAMDWLAASDLRHLLIDTPSVDRADDGGVLGNHRRWWGLPLGADDGGDDHRARHPHRSITEFLSIPDHVFDGQYLLLWQLAPVHSDATPSRPVIYPICPS